MSIVYVTPCSTEDRAVEATVRTIEALHPPGAHRCRRGDWGAPYLDDGRIVVDSHDPDFLVFAVKQQGYGLDAVKEERT